MIKVSIIFWVSKIGKNLQLFGRAYYRATKKILEIRTHLDEPLSESEKLHSWGCSKILLSFLMWFNGHFFNKSAATAAMFSSVRFDFVRPPLLSSFTSPLPFRNREYHLKTFERFTASFP